MQSKINDRAERRFFLATVSSQNEILLAKKNRGERKCLYFAFDGYIIGGKFRIYHFIIIVQYYKNKLYKISKHFPYMQILLDCLLLYYNYAFFSIQNVK